MRLTKLTYTSVNPKPLQRQSVPLVYQVFNEKTVAAMKALKDKLKIQEGTILFIEIISNWLKMMNIKDKFVHQRLRDNFCAPWSNGCESFSHLENICNIITTCEWEGGRGREKKLTKFTASAFVVTTRNSIAAANHLFQNHGFHYILPAVFSTNPLEKFFGNARQRKGGNFYIDIIDVNVFINSLSTTSCLMLI